MMTGLLQALVANALASGSLAPSVVAAVVVHGTGTPLGDPIEVSALSGALAQGESSGPPLLASVKVQCHAMRTVQVSSASVYGSQHACCARQACYGHTEGAAGLTGALAAMCLTCEREAPAVLCLREANAHVCAALRDWAGAARLAPLLPRQSVPSMTTLAATGCHAGTPTLCQFCIGCLLIRTLCLSVYSGSVKRWA